MQYPIVCILGDRGAGKTLLMTAIAVDEYQKNGRKIFSNYHLKGVPYEQITYAELEELPEYLTDAIVLLDELQVGADSYETFKASNKSLYTIVTQLRKRHITLYYTTQRFTQIARRIRQQTNYIYQVLATNIPGVSELTVATKDMEQIRQQIIDLRGYFKYYDTDEVIHFRDLSTPVKKTTKATKFAN